MTRTMNCLEQQINTTLFVRTNRGIQLTPEGEKLYTHISAAMSQIFAAEEELSDSTGHCDRCQRDRIKYFSF